MATSVLKPSLRFIASWSVVLLAAAASMACSAAEEEEDEEAEPLPGCWPEVDPGATHGSVELGVGEETFRPLEPDEEMELHLGPQGGHHFLVRARTRQLNTDDEARPAATLLSAFADGEREIDIFLCPFRQLYAAAGDGSLVLPQSLYIIVNEDWVQEIAGAASPRVLLRVEVVDSDGRYARDDRWVVARLREGQTTSGR